ncbi:response regulator transcription factor [Haloferula sargassicola]|uniref:Transcriptional activator protein ExaE n=1 Tax=Haloferula sargassicola TaxID=490096 RepID=A0ABP9UKW7_9BACT
MKSPPLKASWSVYLIDDHPMMRGGLREFFSGWPEFTVCGEAATAAQALEEMESLNPNLVMLDLTLPDRSGVEVVKAIKVRGTSPRILVFSMHDEILYGERMIRAGAHGYLMKGAPPGQIRESIDTVLAGEVYLSPAATRHLMSQFVVGKDGGVQSRREKLSDRELEVFQLLGEGLSAAEIADRLHISIRTVDTHRTHIRKKLALSDSSAVFREAVIAAILGR